MEDENLQDVIVDENTEVEEATNSNEGEEEAEALRGQLSEALRAKAELTARAKRAEEELKTLKAKPQEELKNNPSQLSDELKLIARGLSDEAIEQAKVIAKGKNISLVDAIKDPLFALFQNDLKEKEKKEEAKLGASTGSGETREEITGTQSGSSREEHKEAFKKALGKM